MKPFRIHKICLLAILFFTVSKAGASIIIVDDFNNNTVGSSWQVQGTTFNLSAENQALKVEYNRTSSSWEWDQFNFTFISQPVLYKYQIAITIKSSISTQLAVKPSYTDGTSDWLAKDIPVTSEYQLYTFSVNTTNQKVLQTIFFYFDGGSTAIKSGIIHIDQIVISSTSNGLLSDAIDNGGILLQNAVEGSAEGNYQAGSKAIFNTAISQAQLVLNNQQSTQEQIDQAVIDLNDANAIIEGVRVRSQKLAGLSLACTDASYETQNMYFNLRQIARYNTLFGMQDATGYGVGWSGNNFRSDVEDVCGSLPAVCSYSIKDVAKGQAWDDTRQRFQYIYNKGGIISLEWHMDNLYGGDFYWANNPYPDSNVVKSILPGGVNHAAFKLQLDNIALFLRNLKGNKGESMPVIFRPWHEHNGNWFWWGDPHCSIDEYKQLWEFTVDYLVNIKNVNNIVFAFSPDRFYTTTSYLQRYPGDNYIDIFGFDDYGDVSNSSGIPTLLSQLRLLVEMAEQRNKIPALTETGLEGVTNPKWFTQFMLTPINNDPVARRIAYQAVWRNANTTHHYAPYPGHASVPDFMDFYNDPWTIFIDDLPAIYDSAMSINGALGFIYQPVNMLKGINVFPNPTNNFLYVKSEMEHVNFRILDVSGKMIKIGNIDGGSTVSISIHEFPQGTYVMHVTNDAGKFTSLKFMVN
jgi:mannan endo-1,4-beta-mannosidase